MTGITRCQIVKQRYYIHPFSPAHKLEAALLYNDILYECSFKEVLTNEEMLEVMIDNGLWSMDEEVELNSIPLRIDALKVEMYGKYNTFQGKRVEQTRRMLIRLRARHMDLAARRHSYDFYTQEGLAKSLSMQYLITHSTKDIHNNFVDIETQPAWLLNRLIEEYTINSPSEEEIRTLSQYGQWRMIWSSGRQEGRVFGVPSICLTTAQQNLISWSKLYDNISEHPEPPEKDVLEDDDLLDGWLITEQKKRERERRERLGDSKGRNSGAQEVFISAETPEDAKRVESMNDPSAAFMKKQRMAVLKQKGTVSEQHMPDSRLQINTQAAQQYRNQVKGK